MNIQPYRQSFTVYVLDSDLKRARTLTEDLFNTGYDVHYYLNESRFREAVIEGAPHIIIVHYEDSEFFKSQSLAGETIESWMQLLPEVHIILLCSSASYVKAAELYSFGLYDCVEFPTKSSWQLLRAVDRAAEADYYMYLNEQLQEANGSGSQGNDRSSFPLFQIWYEQAFRTQNLEQAIDITLKEVCRHIGACDAIFFRYVPLKMALIASQSVGFDSKDIEGVGIDLRSSDPGFSEIHLRRPQDLKGVHELAKKALMRKNFNAFYVDGGGPLGVIVIFPHEGVKGSFQSDPYVRLCIETLCQVARIEKLKKRIVKESIFDQQSEALSQEFITKKISEEVSRSRRIVKPVSILLISIDGYHEFQLSRETRDIDYLVRSVNIIFQKNSRLNDLVGRISEDQFVLVLPHTDKKGAAIKAERLRRIVETADFSKVLSRDEKITISVGVSEYPGLCQDADDLFKTAEEALYQVKKDSKNKVCLASPKNNFVPDFVIKESL